MFSPRVRLQHLFNKAVSFNLEHIALISMFHNFHLSITCTTLFPWIHNVRITCKGYNTEIIARRIYVQLLELPVP